MQDKPHTGLRKSTLRKLSKENLRFLSTLVTYRMQIQQHGYEAATLGLAANLLHATSSIAQNKQTYVPRVVAAHSKVTAAYALNAEIANLLPSLQKKRRLTESLLKLPAALENPTKEGLPKLAGQIWGNARKEKLFIRPLPSTRTNRNPLPAFKAFSHRFMLLMLFVRGELIKTNCDFSTALTSEELKEVFDKYCPICTHPHKAETLKKSVARFERSIAVAKGKKPPVEFEIQLAPELVLRFD